MMKRYLYLLIIIVQIVLLVNIVTAESYSIFNQNPSKIVPSYGIKKGGLDIGNLLLGFFSIKQVGIVSATIDNPVSRNYDEDLYQGIYKADYNEYFSEEEGIACCIEMENGAICQNVPLDYENCVSDVQGTECEQIPECQPGCCIDNAEGLCDPNAPKTRCEANGGEWDRNENCQLPICKKGCCVLGNEIHAVSQTRCNYLASIEGIANPFFEQHISEIACLSRRETQDYGACIIDENCIFTSEFGCLEADGDFRINKLCSHPDIDLCEPTDEKTCVEGRDEVYFKDSCGNIANIYDSSKIDDEDYWNNYYPKGESCNPSSANIDSTCGNCNYNLGSRCDEGICKDMNCPASEETGNINRKNGESWCVYDSFIGDGKDTVGSRHWKRMCVDGEVKVEPCADFRGEVCAMEEVENSDGETQEIATCRTNRWKNCFGINNLEEELAQKKDKCEDEIDCDWRIVRVGDTELELCTPAYPTGFRFWQINRTNLENSDRQMSQMEEICSTADQTCTVVYVCGSCEVNCQCEEEEFTIGMNDFCKSLGDCGAQTNYIGDVTIEGYSIKKGESLGEAYLESLANLANLVAGQFILSGISGNYASLGWERDQSIGGSGSAEGGWNEGSMRIYLDIVTLGLNEWLRAFGLGTGECEVKEIKVKFSCYPWQAPTENQKCDKCNGNPLEPCTEYRCKSLGAACEVLNINTENPICYEINPDDNDAPSIIEQRGITENVVSVTRDGKNINVVGIDDGCIQAYSPIIVELETDEPAECKLNVFTDAEFEEMSPDFVESTAFVYNHTLAMMLPHLEEIPPEFLEGTNYLEKGEMDIYIQCQDTHGNVKDESYVASMCLSPEDDTTPAEIIYSNPAHEGYLGYEITETDAKFWISEPAECKWSLEDKSYDYMENTMICNTTLFEVEELGWPCETHLAGLNSEENNVYIKCKDQPWRSAEEQNLRNINPDSIIYTLYQSKSELAIDSVLPEGTIYEGSEPAEATLEVETSGGAENGKAVCRYNFLNNGWNGEFLNSNSKTHTMKFTTLMAGDYKIQITCEDNARNIATGEIEFSINVDSIAPKVIRAYNLGGQLEIITNEEAICYYDLETCNFNLENGNSMTTGFSNKHDAVWNLGETYYIKCEDLFGNVNPTCAIKLFSDFFV